MEGRSAKASRRFRIRTVILAVGTLGAGSVLVLVGWLFVTSGQTIDLPRPSGPFAVGRASFDWIDTKREDTLAPRSGTRRELMVWIWYPATAAKARPAAYMPEPLLSADRKLFLSGAVTPMLIRDPALVRSHSLDRPPIAGKGADRFPIIVFRPGFGAITLQYSTLLEDLASRGYVVVGVDAPYSAGVVAFPDGRVLARTSRGSPPTSGPRRNFDRLVSIWSADSSFVLDKLAALDSDPASPFHGRLDMASVGAFGHSFGGASAAQFCSEDKRCKAAVDLDGQLFGTISRTGIDKPFMFLLTDHSREADQHRILAEMRSVYDRLPAGRLALEIRGTRHFNVSDMALLRSPAFLSRIVGAIGPIDRRRALTITSDYLAAFFKEHLRRESSAILQVPSPPYPEVRKVEF